MVAVAVSERIPNLLVVEDSETQAIMIRRMLESHGFQVERAASAEAALDHLNAKLPDLVIADFHLPGMSGGELSRQLRLNSRTRSIPLLMLTEAAEVETEREGLESGADAYISKAADPDFLILRIRALLRERPAVLEEKGDEMPHFRRLRFLVLDDDPTGLADHSATLLREGYLVEAASDVDSALAALCNADLPVDCLLMGLPPRRFDSVEACRVLNARRVEERAQQAERSTAPFLLIGIERDGAVSKDKLARAFDAGLDEFIPTLNDHGLLRVRLRAIVRRKMMQDEMAQADADRRERAITVERARMTEALTQANAELGAANDKLIETQAKLVQAAKMASLGELVAGIAHEINNPLAFILAHQATVQRVLSQIGSQDVTTEKARGHIAKAQDRAVAMGAGLKRIRDLVFNLRQFSRLDEGGFQLVDIFEAIDTVLTLLRPKLGDRISVARHYDAPPTLWCSPALLNQVVMNIVSNAADAIEGKGLIDITVTVEGPDYVILIEDSGPGVPEEVQERVFEPFFTTKPIGSGTGLGLAIAYSVVKAHQGAITIGRSPFGGASFKIAVPLTEEMGQPSSPAVAMDEQAPSRQPIPGE
ncbi:response regulator [Acidisoma cellulosilytica]|uniref:histidine kinase n=1 Tax=Acidisoma cellulosilyticum TaxID=2802395 RepID=A0A963Z183_9PROT|nr:response regulator [Acidisoma cellulosilyticum]MCB8879953.1 response regulator [Acidisoma cellulosilyticum]